jgi:hypothetical protein
MEMPHTFTNAYAEAAHRLSSRSAHFKKTVIIFTDTSLLRRISVRHLAYKVFDKEYPPESPINLLDQHILCIFKRLICNMVCGAGSSFP